MRIGYEQGGRTDEARLFAHGAEDEVRLLLGDVVELRLRPLEEAFAREAPRANGYLRLVYVIPLPLEIALDAEGNLDAYLLVWLEDVVEDVVHRVEEAQRAQGKECHQEVAQEVVT